MASLRFQLLIAFIVCVGFVPALAKDNIETNQAPSMSVGERKSIQVQTQVTKKRDKGTTSLPEHTDPPDTAERAAKRKR